MKKLICIFVLLFMLSCSEYINKPKNLIDEDTMAEILADLAINDQAVFLFQGTNLESGTRFVLKTHNVKSDDFVESYKYYVAKDKLTEIADEAQKILLEKDPKAEKHIQEKLKNKQNVPAFAR
ncbi:DUF4296 domain-containing protein [uncultured Chryseobacterium sp.]|uniref:DUF4296 domain-containing protein n=1 Tax=uncultured Chryseobacterium sp. TaxID=259322 RepID=UPI00261A1B1A|nr:DUF4296 domain-containing protein [uncultured Chryseobacterium sp.]